MAGEQGAGGGIESNRRHLSTSTRASADNEPIQETEPQTGKQTEQEEAKAQFQQPSQDSPRGFNPPSSTSTPSSAPLMARASSNSSTVSTPSAPTDSYFAPVPEAKAPAPRPSRPLEPPVTKGTLSELDVCKIMHNPKLRHDINFDPELHFRPNLDGDKGKRKQHKADLFWNTLQDQLVDFVREPEAFYVAHGQTDGTGGRHNRTYVHTYTYSRHPIFRRFPPPLLQHTIVYYCSIVHPSLDLPHISAALPTLAHTQHTRTHSHTIHTEAFPALCLTDLLFNLPQDLECIAAPYDSNEETIPSLFFPKRKN